MVGTADQSEKGTKSDLSNIAGYTGLGTAQGNRSDGSEEGLLATVCK